MKKKQHFFRFVIRNPENEIRFGGTPSWEKKKIKFKPELHSLLSRSVFDSNYFARSHFDSQNLCPVICLLMNCFYKLGNGFKNVTKKEFWGLMNCLEYKSLLTFGKAGLNFTDLNRLESVNSPIPKVLLNKFPLLKFYCGFALNVYRLEYKDKSLKLFPVSLSKFSRSSDRFQVDMLQVSPQIAIGVRDLKNLRHLLLVPNLSRLVTKFRLQRLNWSRYRYVCRTCCFVTTTNTLLLRHYLNCDANFRKPCLGRKATRNRYLHRPFRVCKFSQKIVRNGLSWRRANGYRLLKGFVDIFADFEATHSPVQVVNSAYSKSPKNATEEQVLMSYSYTVKSHYSEINLPEDLALPRYQFCDQSEKDSSKQLLMKFFYDLRNDMISLDNYFRGIVNPNTTSLPPKSRRNPELIKYILSRKFCEICGIKFGVQRLEKK